MVPNRLGRVAALEEKLEELLVGQVLVSMRPEGARRIYIYI